MKKILYYLTKTEEGVLVAIFIAMTIVCFLQVIFRFVLEASLVWSEEFLRAGLMWSSCLGISCAYNRYAHLGVDFFVNLLPEKAQKIFTLISYLISLVFLVLLIKNGYDFTAFQLSVHRMTTSLNIPQACITAAIPVSGVLSCIHIVEHIIEDYILAGKTESKEDE